MNEVKFSDLYSEPSKNGLSIKFIDDSDGYKIVNMKELFAYPELTDSVEMRRVKLSLNELDRFNLIKGDLLFGRRSLVFEGAGKSTLYNGNDENVIFESSIIRVRTDTTKASPGFLKFFFQSPYGKSKIWAIIAGTAVFGIRSSDLANLKFLIPSLPIQTKIASILSSYDELIENNKQRIKLLEEMAEEIYKEWFVRMRFPGYEKAKYFNEQGVEVKHGTEGALPEGWEIKQVNEIIERFPAGKRYDNKSALEAGKVPIIDQGQSGFIGFHNDEPGIYASMDDPIIIFTNHTCYQRLIQFNFSAIQNVLPFKSNMEFERDIYWLHYSTKNLIQFNDYKGHWPEFSTKKLTLPSPETAKQFGELAKPMLNNIYMLEQKNQLLQQTRDLLLPRLISGKLSVEHLLAVEHEGLMAAAPGEEYGKRK